MLGMADIVLALDFGGTKLAAAVAERGATAWRSVERSLLPRGVDAAMAYAEMVRLAGKVLSGARPAAIGVSFNGPVDPLAGMVRVSFQVPGWEAVPLAGRLTAEFDAPAQIENDANAAALGEARFGAGRGAESVLYLTVSTGVGGGVVLDGRLRRGHHGLAGEIGHLCVEPDGPRCACGRRGCLEALASGPAIARHAREALAAHTERPSRLRDLPDAALDARAVAEAAAEGDALAWEVLEGAAIALGRGIGSAANVFDPQRVILGGGVTHAGERYWSVVRSVAQATALAGDTLEIVPAALGDEAPLWGAVAGSGSAGA